MAARFLGGIGRFFITTGIVVLLFVGYQLWGTGLQEASAQNSLGDDFDSLLDEVEIDFPTTTTVAPVETTAAPATTTTTTTTIPAAGGTIPVADQELAEALFREGGEAVARIEIPNIEVSKVVVEGVQVEDLRNGPGHYRATVFPGQEGNSGIAGHRTTYGAPFNRIDELLPGTEFTVTTVQGEHTYRVMSAADAFGDEIRGSLGPDFVLPDNADEVGHIIVPPSATWVLGDFGDNRITLTACHPKFSARLRIIVAAELISAPVDAPPPPPDFDVTDDLEFAGEDLEALEAEAAGEQDDEVAGAAGGSDETEPPLASAFANEVSLDEGLNGDEDALRPAILWGSLAVLAYVGFKELAQRWRRWPSIAIGIVPVVLLMGASFEKIDRFLPAG